MAKDIEQELDAIFTHHQTRVTQARSEALERTATTEGFAQGAALCLSSVVTPALQQMAAALHSRGVAAKVHSDERETRIDVPVSRHARLGHGLGGYPYLRARPDLQTRRMRFERNSTDGRGASAAGDYTIAEVNAELVKALVLDLVRELYGPY